MNLKIGDSVKFLNDVGGGKITKLIDKYTVMVETEDGFDFPFPINELLLTEPETSDSFFKAGNAEQKPEKQKTFDDIINEETAEVISKDNEEVNIYLSFVPENEKSPAEGNQEIHLVNDSNWNLMYVYQIRKQNTFESFPGVLQPNFIEHLKTLSVNEISNIKEIVLQIIFFRKTPYDLKSPVVKSITLKHTKFYTSDSFTKNDFFDKKALIFPILEENPLAEAMENLEDKDIFNVIKNKEVKNKNLNKPKEFKKKPETTIIEVDLHIHTLLENTTGMEAKDMLDYQMKTFNDELQKAQKIHHIKKIVFIHGKGNGKLRNEIRSYLDKNKIKYQDASFQKYGFGATLVFV